MLKNHKNYLLLVVIVFILGLSWPVMKIGLHYIPPLWFTVIRLGLASITIFGVAILRKQFIIPKRRDLPLIITIGIFQLGLFMILANYGLRYVEPGRSAILAYTTSIWVTPLAVVFFGEKINKLKLMGLFLGILGILVLFNPYTFDWSDSQLLKGNAALLLSAISWAIAMLHARYGRWHNTATTLFPWQLLFGTLFCLPLAIIFEPIHAINWTPTISWIIIYTTLFSTAFCFWGIVSISKALSVVVTSLSLLMVPVLGLLFSTFIVEERITAGVLLAMTLIVSGIACVLLASRLRTST